MFNHGMDRWSVLFGVAVLAVGGAGAWVFWPAESADKAWTDMHGSACSGDIEGFFSRVDWQAVTQNMAESTGNGSNANANPFLRPVLDGFRKDIEDQIRLKSAGSWCLAQRTGGDGISTVSWSMGSDRAFTGTFALRGGRYILMKIDRQEPQ